MNLIKGKTIVDDLVDRFSAGEILSADDIIKDYMDSSNELETYRSSVQVYNLLGRARKKLAQEGLFLAALGEKNFGIPKNEGDMELALTWYHKRITGMVKNAQALVRFGENKNLIPAGFRMKTLKLPALT